MIDEIQNDIEIYEADWINWLISKGMDQKSFTATAVGWKVADYKAFVDTSNQLLAQSSQVHIADVNDRKIGSFILKDCQLPMGLQVIKLMQRRSGSNDQLGLDHLDFTVNDLASIEVFLKKMNVSYEWQSNDLHQWISARIINNQEAKFIDHTVLDVGAKEMMLAANKITPPISS